MENIPICTDCIHCSEYENEYVCFRKQNKINPVDGSEILSKPPLCRIERAEFFWAFWACCKHGRFFVHRDLYPQTEIDSVDIETPSDEMEKITEQDGFQAMSFPEVEGA